MEIDGEMRLSSENPVYQAEFECSCGATGYIQATEDPAFCPICGMEGHHHLLELWESEFNIIGDHTSRRVSPQPSPKVVYKERIKIVYRTPKVKGVDRRFGYRGQGATPTNGHRGIRKDPNHKIVNDPPIMTSVLGEDGKRVYTVDCGYTGIRATITSHLKVWHGMSHEEAKNAVKIRNHQWQDKRHRLLAQDCNAKGLNPVSVQIIGYVKKGEGNVRKPKLYRYHIPECGLTGARTTLIRHLTMHHGYDLITANLMSKIRGSDSLADRTHVNKFLEEDPLSRSA